MPDGGSAFCDASIYPNPFKGWRGNQPQLAFIPSPSSAQRNRGIQRSGVGAEKLADWTSYADYRMIPRVGAASSVVGAVIGRGRQHSSHTQFAGMGIRAVVDVRMSAASMMHFRSLCIGVEAGSAFVYNGESCWMHTLIRIEGIGCVKYIQRTWLEKKQDSTQAKGYENILGAGLETWSVETSRTSEVQVEADGVMAGAGVTG
ncbi:hypothetical protein B0H13DRAFT_1880624 [Mycena leptocephala]|nr:hypothetical protein B0H13DRAFT_1880624 [Mycena leptocephala]